MAHALNSNNCVCGPKQLWKRLWHRLRPPAPAGVGLDVHRGLCGQQQLGTLHVVAQKQWGPTSAAAADVTGTTRAGSPWRLWGSGPLLSRTSTAAPFSRRKAMTAVWPFHAARCSAARRPIKLLASKSCSRQCWSWRRWPRIAARLPSAAASAMLSSRRAEKFSRNQFLT